MTTRLVVGGSVPVHGENRDVDLFLRAVLDICARHDFGLVPNDDGAFVVVALAERKIRGGRAQFTVEDMKALFDGAAIDQGIPWTEASS